MNLKKILFAGIIGGIANIIIGNTLIFFGTNILNNMFNLEIPELFKYPNNLLLPVLSVVIGFIWAIAYSIINKGIPGKIAIFKGLFYGFILWFIGSVPQNLIEYLANNQKYYLYKIFPEFIQYLLVCLIISIVFESVNKNKKEKKSKKTENIQEDFE
jgi:hypothetical protein